MATFQERLNQAIEMRDIKPAELSRQTGVNEGAISQYRSGAYKASQRNLEKLAKALNVSIPWLMGGDVSMIDHEESTPTPTPRPSLLYAAHGGEADEDAILQLYALSASATARKVAVAYDKADNGTQTSVRKLLDVEE